MATSVSRFLTWLTRVPALRTLRHSDFRWLWIGAFLSFTGSQVQNVAQGYYVYELTGDKSKLAMVMFCLLLPVSVFGPIAGVVADVLNKRTVIVVAMIVNSLGALYLGIAASFGFLQYWHILAVSVVVGFVQTFEAPTRQSIVRLVVPDEEFAMAVPAQALTFNLARVAGPAVGGLLADTFGPSVCFYLNAASFSGLVAAAFMIKADLSPVAREPQPIRDLLTEGMLYTFRNRALKTLFIMESITSLCTFYISQMPAIAKSMLGLDARGLGYCFTSVGVGAVAGLVSLAAVSQRPIKPFIARTSMIVVAVGLGLLSITRSPWLAFPVLGAIGFGTIVQFNTTNTLFQLMSPPHLRGRVLSMHMWALAGLAPVGILVFGLIAEHVSLPIALASGSALAAIGSLWAIVHRHHVQEPTGPPL